MRVTANTYSTSLLDQLNRLGLRQNRLQTEVSSGQRVQAPEDDPAAMQRVLEMQAESDRVAQYQQNVTAQTDLANVVYSSMKALKTVSDRAGEIATLAGGLRSPQELSAYADQVTLLIKQAVQAANTQQNGSYLFGGTRSDQPPFVMATDANGRVTSVTYQGNASVASVEVGEGVTATAQVPGANTTGSGPRGLITDAASGADLFNHLISLQNHLVSGQADVIASTDRSQLIKDEDNLTYQFSANGAVQSRLQASSAMLSDRATSLTQQVSNTADADLAQTIVQLNSTQTAYQAALQSGAKLLNLSLLNFLQ